jgi:hypothetical protein
MWLQGKLAASWPGRRDRRSRLSTSTSDRLIADAEAFLSGHYADGLRQRGEPVPGWAWLNRLAHGDLTQIGQVRRSLDMTPTGSSSWSEEAWRTAEALLTNELLELVGDDATSLSHVQRAVLVPLELELIETEPSIGLTALELLQAARAALRPSSSS